MRHFKKHSKTGQKKGVVLGASQNEILNLDSSSRMRPQMWTQTQNWIDTLDASLLYLLTEENTLGNNVNGSFTNLAWVRIVSKFNSRNNMNMSKDQIKSQLKVLKKSFILYNSLANKSGWGWGFIQNIGT